jgi:LysM repeat protein
MIKQFIFLCIALVISPLPAQNMEDLQINPLLINRSFQEIKNPTILHDFFQKLKDLEHKKRDQITIVQIGDSHVQGPYFPQYIRQGIQNKFGNAGRGFVFPYRVAETNGAVDVKFKATGNWQTVRNVKSDGSDPIGLSGIYLETSDEDFLMEINWSSSLDKVSEIQIISPHAERFKLSTHSQKNILKKTHTTQTYQVKSGDYLGKIAGQFNTTVKKIQQTNGMKNGNLRAGQRLKIPTGLSQNKVPSSTTFNDLKSLNSDTFQIPDGMDQLYVRASQKKSKYVLDGLLLNTSNKGIVFHGIGVNGAKFSDYNKFPRFFDQVAALQPDLIIISLGTNESFYNSYSEEKLKSDMGFFNRQMIQRGMTGCVLLTSPPPSMKNRREINSTATAYAYEMGVFAHLNSWAFYDLHSVSRSSKAMPDWYKAKLTSGDKIHFLEKGYQLQAELLVEALLNYFSEYNK